MISIDHLCQCMVSDIYHYDTDTNDALKTKIIHRICNIVGWKEERTCENQLHPITLATQDKTLTGDGLQNGGLFTCLRCHGVIIRERCRLDSEQYSSTSFTLTAIFGNYGFVVSRRLKF